ncbi:MAG: hypothetical protein AUH31_04880 [Armatimonadetes bacterium 13_1_40CM_64_14]|nr:MAG: hypothetical protein AUH31_04880 [Armatimonadetes bacterium 13_1_40CM_64_14]
MAPLPPFTPYERKYLAGIVHQVWRACQVYVTVSMERGPSGARPALDELTRWAVAQRRELGPRGGLPDTLSAMALRVGRELLTDVETISRRVVQMVAALEKSSLPADQSAGPVSWPRNSGLPATCARTCCGMSANPVGMAGRGSAPVPLG